MDKSYDYDYETENDYTWDDRYYGTGNTEPPKERSGPMALMLILIIFLFGIINDAMIYRKLKQNANKFVSAPVGFH